MALVLLQLTYVLMILLAAGLTVLYVLALPAIFATVHLNAVTIVLIAILPVTGAIVTFFLFKPLLATAPKKPGLRRLDPCTEPVLFEFVQRLCWAVGSRAPSEIYIDMQVNASASLHRGWLGFLTGRLALTIGLPLAAGLTLRQFSGVLAHEFGHFSQQAGLRLYFLIGTIRLWFARVAYERDAWDDQLDQMRIHSGWRTQLILNVAYASVGGSRAILRGLLHVANWISAGFSRQMEFDADRYEASLVGADVFEQTTNQLAVLGPLAEDTWKMLADAWELRRLPEDIPSMVRYRNQNLNSEIRERLIVAAREEVTKRWATHPSANDRIASVRGLTGSVPSGDDGEFPEDLAADVLFSSFADLCRKVTRDQYDRVLEGQTEEATLEPSSVFLDQTEADARRKEAIQNYFGPLTTPSRWFRLATEGGDLDADADSIQLIISSEDETAGYWKTLETALSRNAGLWFLQAGGQINPQSFELTDSSIETATAENAEIREQLAAEIERLRERYKPQSLVLVWYGEDRDLMAAYRAFSSIQDALLELRFEHTALSVVRLKVNLLSLAAAQSTINRSLERLRDLSNGILAGLGSESLNARMWKGLPKPESQTPEDLAKQVLVRADLLGESLLGEICKTSQALAAAASGSDALAPRS